MGSVWGEIWSVLSVGYKIFIRKKEEIFIKMFDENFVLLILGVKFSMFVN